MKPNEMPSSTRPLILSTLLLLALLAALGYWWADASDPSDQKEAPTKDKAQASEDPLEIIGPALESLTAFWDSLSVPPLSTSRPLRLYQPPLENACGSLHSVQGPLYCPLDQRLYVDETFASHFSAALDPSLREAAMAYMMAHLLGHHLQEKQDREEWAFLEGGIPPDPEEGGEIQADFFAGYSLARAGTFSLSVAQWKEVWRAYEAMGTRNPLPTSWVWIEDFSADQREARFQAFLKGWQVAGAPPPEKAEGQGMDP